MTGGRQGKKKEKEKKEKEPDSDRSANRRGSAKRLDRRSLKGIDH